MKKIDDCEAKNAQISKMALEKVNEQQLDKRQFEIYQTISCFRAFLQTLSFNDIMKQCAFKEKILKVLLSSFTKIRKINPHKLFEPLLDLLSSARFQVPYIKLPQVFCSDMIL